MQHSIYVHCPCKHNELRNILIFYRVEVTLFVLLDIHRICKLRHHKFSFIQKLLTPSILSKTFHNNFYQYLHCSPLFVTSRLRMKTVIRSFVNTHPITFALLRFTPILPFRMRDKRKYAEHSTILTILSDLFFLVIIALGASLCYKLTVLYMYTSMPISNSRSVLTITLLTLFCTLAIITLLVMDRCSLVNNMTKTLHDVRYNWKI